MKLRGILVILACLAVTGSGAALADATNGAATPGAGTPGAATSPIINGDAACAGAPVPSVSVNVPKKDPVLDRSLGYADLSRRESGDNRTASSRNHTAFGLTGDTIAAEGGVGISGHEMPDGRYCLWIDNATILLSWDVVVHIAREIKPGSCPDRAVREHEAKHVALEEELHPVLQQRIIDGLRQPGLLSLLTSDASLGQEQLQGRLHQILEQLTAAFLVERNQLQLKIDTPQEYARVRNVCGRPAFDALMKP